MQVMPRPAAILCALMLLAAACTSPAGPGPSASSIPAVNATSAELLPVTVDELPDLDLEGYGTLVGQVEGTPLVVNVWASWCGPCREEAPDLAAAADRYGDRVQFLGVDVRDYRGSAREFVYEFGWTYPSVFDPSGSIMTDLGLTGPPATLFYAADGTLVERVPGPVSPEALERGIRRLLA
jgi:cytochrome c biogenesis protein CcmG/thiol:disulfide interchange protein DsbE